MAAAGSEQASLQWQRIDGQVIEVALWAERVVTIGREPTNTLVIESPFVGRRHATVSWEKGEFHLKDNNSANGTRLNGSPISDTTLQDGDLIEIGDQVIAFVLGEPSAAPAPEPVAEEAPEPDAAPAAAAAGAAAGRASVKAASRRPAARESSGGGNKGLKLAVAAFVTLGVMIGGLFFLLQLMTAATAPATNRPRATRPRTTTGQAATPNTPPPKFDTKRADEAEARAKRAGTNAIEAMYDEAMVYTRSGRLLEAAQLLTGVIAREPSHEKAKINLPRVLNERELAIQEQRGEAERAEFQLRYTEAARHWERVLLLTEPSEPAHSEAAGALEKIRQRTAPAR